MRMVEYTKVCGVRIKNMVWVNSVGPTVMCIQECGVVMCGRGVVP